MIPYYAVVFGISVLMTTIYIFRWHKHFNTLITLTFILTPIINLAYLFFSTSTVMEEAVVSNKITYLGGCYLLLIMTLTIFNLCKIELKKWIRLSLLLFSTLVFITAMRSPESKIFNTEVTFEIVDGVVMLHKKLSVMHYVFFVMVGGYILLSLGAIIYSYFKRKQASRKIILLLLILEIFSLICFAATRIFSLNFDLTPLSYDAGLLIFIIVIRKMSLYDITDSAIDTIIEKGDTGFISFDNKFNYVGSNETAKTIVPEINDLVVDKPIDNEKLNNIKEWLNDFKVNNLNNVHYLERNDKTYVITTSLLYVGKSKKGYQLTIKDDTQNQEYIKLINTFNDELKNEVEEKTREIVKVSDNFIIGLATMVESRDNSTGGHIKRTSEGVRLLVEEMKKDKIISDEFCERIIKAAPMHDIGKIAVDDRILRKPGKFTPEEFEEMKKHSEAGAKILSEIVDDKHDKEFKKITVNVAHFHHERWDGSGYPKGLKGEEIPLEARIMAIADVYDALVSKRVYKEKFSFEESYKIIKDGMGTQFDKSLEVYFDRARENLEKYYSEIDC